MADHLQNVRKYDADADEQVVQKIVNHCGIALKNRDSSTVAVSDPAELNRVKEGFCTKKLELDSDQADRAVQAAADEMKGERGKDRVAFYYLVAKHADKLDVFKA